jgi:hypothetical protein
MKMIIYVVLILPLNVFGQRTGDIISVQVGYTSTNVVFREAFEPSINVFGTIFKSGKTFGGEGPEFGFRKNLSKLIFVEATFSTFSGRETKVKVNSNENYYTLKGVQLPITVNYLFGDSSKRLRIYLGSGAQFLKGHLQQYETIATSSGQTTNQITNINISEIQFVLRPGVQFRILPNFFALFNIKAGISSHGRYVDNFGLSLEYTF